MNNLMDYLIQNIGTNFIFWRKYGDDSVIQVFKRENTVLFLTISYEQNIDGSDIITIMDTLGNVKDRLRK